MVFINIDTYWHHFIFCVAKSAEQHVPMLGKLNVLEINIGTFSKQWRLINLFVTFLASSNKCSKQINQRPSSVFRGILQRSKSLTHITFHLCMFSLFTFSSTLVIAVWPFLFFSSTPYGMLIYPNQHLQENSELEDIHFRYSARNFSVNLN